MKIKICKAIYTISYPVKVDAQNSWGECSAEFKTIKVRKNLSQRNRDITLLHEILHAIEFETKTEVSHAFIKKADKEIYLALKQLFEPQGLILD